MDTQPPAGPSNVAFPPTYIHLVHRRALRPFRGAWASVSFMTTCSCGPQEVPGVKCSIQKRWFPPSPAVSEYSDASLHDKLISSFACRSGSCNGRSSRLRNCSASTSRHGDNRTQRRKHAAESAICQLHFFVECECEADYWRSSWRRGWPFKVRQSWSRCGRSAPGRGSGSRSGWQPDRDRPERAELTANRDGPHGGFVGARFGTSVRPDRPGAPRS